MSEQSKQYQPHQQRVVDEKTELDAKLDKLVAFFEMPMFKTIQIEEQMRLAKQCEYMSLYSQVLGDRIDAFN